ncbi:MAG: hypothetical protein LBB59_00845, partial [Campylobacteraceae bacterium]|nr:hypothetical protein [Campylobacteraceae bacterium]
MKCKGKEALGKTAKMIDTIKNMFKNDAVTGNGEKIKTFARDVMELKGNDTKAIETDIASKQVNIFKKILGIDLSGFKRRFESGYIRHTFNKHGAKSNDARPVTEEDFALYEDIVTNPNKISKSVTDDGKPAVVYVKKYDDKVYIVEEVREKTNGQHRLVFRNMFKNSLTHPDEAIRNPKYAGDLKFI